MKKKVFIPICIALIAVVGIVSFSLISNNGDPLLKEYSDQTSTAKLLSMDEIVSESIDADYSDLQSSPDNFSGKYVDKLIQITQDVGDGQYLGVELSDDQNFWAIYDVRETGSSFVVGNTVEICGVFSGNVNVSLTDSRVLSIPSVIATHSETDQSVISAMYQIEHLSDPAEASEISQILEVKETVESLSDGQKSRVRNILKYNDIINTVDDIADTMPYRCSINAATNQYNLLDNVDGFNLTRMDYATSIDNNGDPHYYVYMAFDYTDVYGTNTRKESIAMYDNDGSGSLLDRDTSILYGAAQSIMNEDDTKRQEINIDYVKYCMSKY